jgi:hypothetical protein
VLAGVLPGIREVRTPLAVGFAWMLVIWFGVAYLLPEKGDATGPLRDAYRLADAAGPAGTAIALSVVAYLIGAVVVPATLGLTYRIGDLLRRGGWGAVTPGRRREERAERELTWAVTELLSDRFVEDESFRRSVLGAAEGLDEPRLASARGDGSLQALAVENRYVRGYLIRATVDVVALAAQLQGELYAISVRLRGTNDRLRDDIERLHSEADFRLAMFPPVATLLGVLAVRWHGLWLLVSLASVALIFVAVALRANAEALIAQAVAAGHLEDPSLDRMRAAPISFLTDPRAQDSTGAPSDGT